MSKKLTLSLFVLSFVIIACKVAYKPPVTVVDAKYLVVEGLINISDSTYIKLSRTVTIGSVSTIKPELKAVVSIESNTGSSYPLSELGKGKYAVLNLNLSSGNQYRLRIKTSNGEQYVSDFDQTKVTPAIDSINFQATTDLKLYVSTHGATNSTRYYRWDYTEAYEFHANFYSQYISNGLTLSPRSPAQQVFYCYRGDTSSTITIGTSVQLSNDVINQELINTIMATDEKLSVKYSIQVKQYALTENAYNYWALLKKNTEQLGSIFDAQPSASIGNIHCVNNPGEVVIGYISAGTVTSQRIFITKQQLPNWLPAPYYPDCGTDSLDCCVPLHKVPPTTNEFVNYKSPEFEGYVLLQDAIMPIIGSTGSGWLAAAANCTDCTLRGTVTPPTFWK